MRKMLHVARREFVETVKTKTFIISLLLAPLMTIGIIMVSERTKSASLGVSHRTRTLAILDRSGELTDDLTEVVKTYNREHPDGPILLTTPDAAGEGAEATIEAHRRKVRDGILDGVAVVAADVVDGAGGVMFYTRPAKAVDVLWPDVAAGLVNRAVFNVRCRRQQWAPEQVNKVRARVPVTQVAVGAEREAMRGRDRRDRLVTLMIPFAFMFLMYTGVVATGQHMLTSIIEEKSSRIVEVLLAALTPLELMAGKILGLAAVGLTIIGVWLAMGAAAAMARGMLIDLEPGILAYFLVYYVLGFLLYSSILAALGSVCNALKEAQSLMMPVVMVMVIPMVAWFKLSQEAAGPLARTLSFVPPITPQVMILRLASGAEVSGVEIVASIVVLAGSVVLAMLAAAKVFRTGILMHGKRPRLREMLRWVAEK